MNLGSAYSSRLKAGIALLVIALCGAACGTGATADNSYYFRLKAAFTYKGEPQDFDIVVGCHVTNIRYVDSSSTYEAGLTPTLFGRRMADGGALVVRVPDACHGQTTANGQVPAGFTPLAVVYNDAATLAFGDAYLTSDAYDSPRSVLTFKGATIESADASAFDQFRRSQTNVVTPEEYFSNNPRTLKSLGLPEPRLEFGKECWGYARFKLTGDQKVAASKAWPSNHPRFWRPDKDSINAITDGPGQLVAADDRDEQRTFSQYMAAVGQGVADLGITIASGPSRINGGKGSIPLPSIYPDYGGWGAAYGASDPAATARDIEANGPLISNYVVINDGADRGLASCRPEVRNYPVVMDNSSETTGAVMPPEVRAYLAMSGANFADRQQIQGLYNGDTLLFVENDEFMFVRFDVYLDSVGGAV